MGIILEAEKPDSFERFYEAMKKDFLKLAELYEEFKREHGRKPTEEELAQLIVKAFQLENVR